METGNKIAYAANAVKWNPSSKVWRGYNKEEKWWIEACSGYQGALWAQVRSCQWHVYGDDNPITPGRPAETGADGEVTASRTARTGAESEAAPGGEMGAGITQVSLSICR